MTIPESKEIERILVSTRNDARNSKLNVPKLTIDEARTLLTKLVEEAHNKGYDAGFNNRTMIEKSKDKRIAKLEQALTALNGGSHEE